jgi:hypothetical protein
MGYHENKPWSLLGGAWRIPPMTIGEHNTQISAEHQVILTESTTDIKMSEKYLKVIEFTTGTNPVPTGWDTPTKWTLMEVLRIMKIMMEDRLQIPEKVWSLLGIKLWHHQWTLEEASLKVVMNDFHYTLLKYVIENMFNTLEGEHAIDNMNVNMIPSISLMRLINEKKEESRRAQILDMSRTHARHQISARETYATTASPRDRVESASSTSSPTDRVETTASTSSSTDRVESSSSVEVKPNIIRK